MKQAKPRKCKAKGCTNTFIQRKSTEVVCSLNCAISEGKRKEALRREKELRLAKQLDKLKFKELKEKNKKTSKYEAEAKKVFQKYVRLRDAGNPCISCGSNSPLVDGGHFKKAEIYSGVIFHEHNCNLQCQKCNRFLGGNELNYRVGLIAKIGLDNVEALERLADETRRTKLSKHELVEIKKLFAEKIKLLYLE